MFRINFYKSYEIRRNSERRNRKRLRLGGVLVLATTIVFGTQVVSSFLVRDQVNALRRGLPVLEQRVGAAESVGDRIQVARQLVKVRARRLDWAPKLVAVSEALDVGLVLEKIDATSTLKGQGSHMTISGRSRAPGTTLGAISGYTDALRDESRIAVDFPVATLENIRSDGGGFEIRCQRREENR